MQKEWCVSSFKHVNMLCLLNISAFSLITKPPLSIFYNLWIFSNAFMGLWLFYQQPLLELSPFSSTLVSVTTLRPVLLFRTVRQGSTDSFLLHFVSTLWLSGRPGRGHSVSGCSENANAKCYFWSPKVSLPSLSEVHGMTSRWIHDLTVGVWMGACFLREKGLF